MNTTPEPALIQQQRLALYRLPGVGEAQPAVEPICDIVQKSKNSGKELKMRSANIFFHLSLLFLFLHVMVFEPPAVYARDIRVDGDCSLHDAIITVNSETSTGGCRMPSWGTSRIFLKEDITLAETLPEIWADLTIDGHGHQISGDKLHQVFTVYKSDLTISNLHIVDGFSAEHGGAIYVHDGELNLGNSSISSSAALGGGGAIYVNHGTASITGSVISGNSAGFGGGVYMENGSLNTSESTLSENVAASGGAIYIFRSWANIVDSRVEHNLAKGRGGGIAATDGSLHIKHSTIHANRALEQGGGFVLARVDAMILDTTISDNLAGSDGGAIYWSRPFSDFGSLGGPLKITQSALTGNRAVERGGAIFAGIHDVFVSNSTFYDNKAGGNGGAFFSEAREATFTHVTFMQNAALNGGGVYLRTPDVLTLRNSIIAGSTGGDCVGGLEQNKGNWIEDGSCKPRYRGDPQLNRSAGTPAYFPLRRESPAINRADPEFCLEQDQHGTQRPRGEACDIGAYEAVDWVEREYDYRLRAPVVSPTIFVDEDCSLADAIASANSDKATGGCIAGDDADIIRLSNDLTLEDTVLDISSVLTLDDPLPDVTSVIVIEGENHLLEADGNIVFIIKFGDLTINNLTLVNAASNVFRDFDGGAIILHYGKLQLSNVTVKDSWAMNGAAIYSYDSDIVINDSVFENNLAGEMGGALYIDDGSVSITNSIFSGNSAEENGGAIYGISSPSIHISSSAINDNRTTGQGGGIYVYGSVRIKDSSLQRNEATKGGAIAARGYSSVKLENVDIADNIAEECPDVYEEMK